MYCEKCGKEIESNDLFCQFCGAPVEKSDIPTDADGISPEQVEETQNSLQEKNEAVAMDEMSDTVVITEDENDENTANFEPVTNVYTAPKGNKIWNFFKKMKKSTAIVLVAVLATVSAFASPVVRNGFLKLVLSPEGYFKYVLLNNFGDGSKAAGEFIDAFKNSAKKGQSVNGNVVLTVGDGLTQAVSEIAGEDIDEYVDWIEKASAEYDVTVKGNSISYNLGLNLNDQKITDFDVCMDAENEMLYMGFPELSKEYIGAELPSEFLESMEQMEKLKGAIPDKKVINKLAGRYAKIVATQIKDVDESNDTVEADGISQKATKVSISVSEETLYDISVAVLEEAKDDKDLEKVINGFEEADIAPEEDLYDAFCEEIEYALEELESVDPDSEELFELNLWVNNKGEIIGFGVSAEGVNVELLVVEKGNKFGVLFEISGDELGNSIKIEGSGKGGRKNRSGELYVKFGEYKLAKITLDKFNSKALEKGYFDGTILFEFEDGVKEMMSMFGMGGYSELSQLAPITDFKLEVIGKSKSAKKMNETINLYYDDELFASLSATANIGNGGKIKAPKDYVEVSDQSDMEEWAENIDTDKIIDNLDKAGVPSEWIEILESEIQ